VRRTRISPGEHVVRILGHRLRVSVRGNGPSVLLINGLGASIALWEPLHQDLADFRVISFDAPGSGRSSTPRVPYTIGALADVVANLLDVLGEEAVDVVGYSFGGALAQQFARDYPHRVRRLVLGATTCGWGGLSGTVPSVLSVLTPVPELALDDVQRHAFARELDRVRVARLMRRKRRRTPVRTARRRSAARAADGVQARPRVRPLITQNDGPTGMVCRALSLARAARSPSRPSRLRAGARPCRGAPGLSHGAYRGRAP
jgi:pimeloyl-ACP methyl ester carboxylesterase